MFSRQETSGNHIDLQIIGNRREQGKGKRPVITTLGRLDQLQQEGQPNSLRQSGVRFAESVLVFSAHRRGQEIPPGFKSLQYVEVGQQGKRFVLCKEIQGIRERVFRTTGVAILPTGQNPHPGPLCELPVHSATP